MVLYGRINGLTIDGREIPRRADGGFDVPEEHATEELKRAFELVEEAPRYAAAPRDEKRGVQRGARG